MTVEHCSVVFDSIIVVTGKFQSGYDEPALHIMYVDKTLSGIMADEQTITYVVTGKRELTGGDCMTDWSHCPAVKRKPGKISGAWAFTGT